MITLNDIMKEIINRNLKDSRYPKPCIKVLSHIQASGYDLKEKKIFLYQHAREFQNNSPQTCEYVIHYSTFIDNIKNMNLKLTFETIWSIWLNNAVWSTNQRETAIKILKDLYDNIT